MCLGAERSLWADKGAADLQIVASSLCLPCPRLLAMGQGSGTRPGLCPQQSPQLYPSSRSRRPALLRTGSCLPFGRRCADVKTAPAGWYLPRLGSPHPRLLATEVTLQFWDLRSPYVSRGTELALQGAGAGVMRWCAPVHVLGRRENVLESGVISDVPWYCLFFF